MKSISYLTAVFSFATGVATADQEIRSPFVDKAPRIDGYADEAVWKNAPAITTRDQVANIDIELRTVHTGQTIFFLVCFPDDTEDRQHKTLEWNEALQGYRSGPEREDSFVFKWNMGPYPVDLTISGEDTYKADLWYWKAVRTDPVGFADDKHHLYGATKFPQSKSLYTQSGRPVYLARLGDEGRSAYSSRTYDRYVDRNVARYANRQPSGSRADVRAKGLWKNGYWTIEFSRNINTGYTDDVQFDKRFTYTFGVSRYEIAGKPANPKLGQPLYESGEIGELLTLRWNQPQ